MNILERDFVHDTYQKISEKFSDTRAYLWKSVKEFLDSIKKNSIIVEIGSGNGKNLLRRKDCLNLAFDLCSNFTNITQNKGIDSVIANNLYIPLKDNIADAVLSIAVIHHLSSEERRLKCLKELIRILKPGGKLLVQVWALEQDEKSRRKFTEQDNYIEFNSSDKKVKELRFYHVFIKDELDNLVKKCNNVIILNSYWEVGNWVMLLQKTPSEY